MPAQLGAKVAEAVCTYVADRTGQPSAGFMRGDAIATLQACHVDESLVSQAGQLIATCEHLQYAGGSNEEISSIIESAKALVTRLESAPSLKAGKQGTAS